MSDRKAIPATKRTAARSTTKSPPKTKTLKEKLALKREKKKLTRAGRPKGSTVSLLKREIRFDVAIFIALSDIVGFNKYAAACQAIMLSSPAPIIATNVENVLVRLSIRHRSAVFKRARYILEQAEASHETTNIEEREWIINSVPAVALLMRYVAMGNVMGQMEILKYLGRVDAGWVKLFERLSERLSRALLSNFPPDEMTPPRRVRALIEKLREKNKQDQ